jgi:CRP-like cAMP-binding protein
MNEFQAIRQAILRFQSLSEQEWAAFAGKLQIRRFKKGDYLIREGQVENAIYFINKGSTRNYFLKDGKEFTVDFQFAGDFVTAYFSFITREPSSIFIEWLEEAEVVEVAHQTLHHFYKEHHNGERIGRLMAEAQYVKRIRKEMDFLSYTAEERYVQLMEKNPQLIQQISVKHLSSYLGIQPESLSRIRKLHARS